MARAIKIHPAAGSYARALLAVGQESGQTADYDEELRAIVDLLSSGPERVFFESPKIPRSEKKQVLEKVFSGKVSDHVLNLLRILVDRDRQDLLGQISSSFSELHDEVLGRVHVAIRSASELAGDTRPRIVAALKAKLQREIIDTASVDPSLIGGMTIRIGDTQVDGSVKTKLNKVRETMVSQRFGSDLFQ